MEIVAKRDLLKDRYGNYYFVSYAAKDSLTLINAALYYAFKEIMNEELVERVKAQYPNDVACGKYFADLVKTHIEKIEKGEIPGSIYDIEEVKGKFDLHMKPIYDESFHL